MCMPKITDEAQHSVYQTFSDAGLRLLGRDHSSSDAISALDCSVSLSPPVSISVDLIFGRPGQVKQNASNLILCDQLIPWTLSDIEGMGDRVELFVGEIPHTRPRIVIPAHTGERHGVMEECGRGKPRDARGGLRGGHVRGGH